MPVKPDSNSEHLQLVITSGKKFHQTFTVIVKNSNVMVQPTSSEFIHITLHSQKGTKNRKNCHFRIDKQSVKDYKVETNNELKLKKGMLVEWNREVPSGYNSPLELIFPSCFIKSKKADLVKDYRTNLVDYDGVLYMNFWFTTSDRIDLEKYWESTGLKVLMFTKINTTNENFAITYHIKESDESFRNMVQDEGFFEIDVSSKIKKVFNCKRRKTKFTFGRNPPDKKSIIIY